ncbi:hypothetical protein [Rhodoferax sp. GW822-FHT02A01]|uniref:hypothetical protein n=1 Tax=Rhodoferax sp. GW822-FHT02A01 TaxID=3141537 RepID=UPI00315D3079
MLTRILTLCIMAVLSLACHAQDYTVGSWAVVKSLSGIQIAKANTGDNAAGVMCILATDRCFAYAGLGIDCVENAQYPLLVNTATGAFSSSASCRHLSANAPILEIDDFDRMIQAFESGGEIGIVTPMLNGQFKVARFSTIGATAAIRDARANPRRKIQPNKPSTASTEFL